MSACTHDWHRDAAAELPNGAHIFRCTRCCLHGWRKRFRRNANDPPDPIRVYCGRRQDILKARITAKIPVHYDARPMSARRARNGGYVPPGSSG